VTPTTGPRSLGSEKSSTPVRSESIFSARKRLILAVRVGKIARRRAIVIGGAEQFCSPYGVLQSEALPKLVQGLNRDRSKRRNLEWSRLKVGVTVTSSSNRCHPSRMARLARVVVPGIAHHVTQHSNGRARIFFSNGDYALYRDLLAEQCRRAARRWRPSLDGGLTPTASAPACDQSP